MMRKEGNRSPELNMNYFKCRQLVIITSLHTLSNEYINFTN